MTDAISTGAAGVAGTAKDWKEPLGRIGLVGQGVVATIVGIITNKLATGAGSTAGTNEGAIKWLAAQPLGKFLLIALTVALFALAVWRALDAIMGDPVEGSEPKDRLKYAFLAFTFGALAITCLSATIANWTEDSGSEASSGGSGNEQSQEAASTVFDWPAGRWLVGALGVGLIGYGLFHLYKQVAKTEFAERLDVDESHWMIKLGRLGYSAQGLIYMAVGYFFLQSAIAFDPKEAKGPSGALQELASYTWGKWLLWIIAIGLFLYGVFCICEAKYRKAA